VWLMNRPTASAARGGSSSAASGLPDRAISASSFFEIVTERVDELRIYFRDPDGHLLELATPVAGILR
jgi:catechol 2,3-dioxygenase-like lactoylglutathione lyase family enzyme